MEVSTSVTAALMSAAAVRVCFTASCRASTFWRARFSIEANLSDERLSVSMSARIAASALWASRRVVLRERDSESRSDWRRERVWFSCCTLFSSVIDGVETEEVASPDVDVDSVGEGVGGGDGVGPGGVVRHVGTVATVVSEVDTTNGMTVDPFVSFRSWTFEWGLESV